jgi:co-chaperonin GroES (HSP10)
MEKKKPFPVQAYGDTIIVRRLEILNRDQKKAKAAKLIIAAGAAPKNIMDIEKQKAEQMTSYDDAEFKLVAKWDENPNQAIVMAVGPGRDLGNGNIFKPSVGVGKHIFYRGNAGEPIIVNKQLYWIIHDNEIFGIVPAAELIK